MCFYGLINVEKGCLLGDIFASAVSGVGRGASKEVQEVDLK